jgi:hypothetical protein
LLDEHFGALGGWIAAMLVKLGDLKLAFLPADDLGRLSRSSDGPRRPASAGSRPILVRVVGMSASIATSVVLLEVSERIATVTLNRPAVAQRPVERGVATAPPAARARPMRATRRSTW